MNSRSVLIGVRDLLDKMTYRKGGPQAEEKKVNYSLGPRPPGREQAVIAVSAVRFPSRAPGVLADKLSAPGKSVALIIDHALAASGTAVAIGSIAFAASMIAQNNSGTRPEPSDGFRLARFGHTATHLAQEPLRPLTIHSIDYEATGSIFRPGSGHGAHRRGTRFNPATVPQGMDQADNYVLSFVYINMALVKSIRGFYAVRPGKVLPTAGRVRLIERRGDKWVLATEQTVIAETN